CRSCHSGTDTSSHATVHRTMTQVPTPASLPTNMDRLELAFDGTKYKVERRGDAFFVRKRSGGGSSYGDAQRIVLVTGSHTLRVPWLETGQGRTLEQFPFAYIVAEKMWAPVTETFLMPPRVKDYYPIGAWNGACMDCRARTGQSRPVEAIQSDS